MEKTSLLALGKVQRILLLTICFLLSMALLFMRIGLKTSSQLDLLARNSIQPEIALKNGHPTIIEFYADWCKVCQEMAPSMLSLKEKYKEDVDIILLNVDNPKWLDLVEKYEVNGIPQLNLFDDNGLMQGQFKGSKKIEQIEQLLYGLINKEELNIIPKINNVNELTPMNNKKLVISDIKPRSHG